MNRLNLTAFLCLALFMQGTGQVQVLSSSHVADTISRSGKDTLILGGALNQYVDYSPPYLYWLPADETKGSYTDALKLFSAKSFLKWNRNIAFTKGITGKPFWLAIWVKDTSASVQTYLWSFYTTSCKYEFYEFDSTLKIISQADGSTYQTINERPYPVRSVSFPFIIQGGEVKLLLVKVQATNTDVLYADQDFSTPEDFLLWEIGYTVLLNRYFGFFIFALLANILLFVFVGSKIYGWLSVYIAFLLLYNLNDFCFDVLIFPEWLFRKFVLIPKYTWVVGATFSSLIVFNRFTDQRTFFPKWYKISSMVIKILQVLLPSSIVLHLSIADHQDIGLVFFRFMGYLILAGAIIFQFVNLFYVSFKKQRAGLFFLVSSGPLIISAFFYFYYMFTDVNLYILLPGNVINACCYEIILLTIIFIYDYRNKNNDRNRLLEESLIAERKITSAILNTQELERKRIAEDLHDGLGSSLAALKIRLQKSSLQEKEMISMLQVIDKASSDTRDISHNLMPPEFERTPLDSLLSTSYSKLNNESDIQFHFHSSGYTPLFAKEKELVIYRIINELTQNILKHSEATEATIQLLYYDMQLEIMCEDNGKGIPLEETDGIGLKNIRSRVRYLGGDMHIDTGQRGTTVMIQIPYEANEHV